MYNVYKNINNADQDTVFPGIKNKKSHKMLLQFSVSAQFLINTSNTFTNSEHEVRSTPKVRILHPWPQTEDQTVLLSVSFGWAIAQQVTQTAAEEGSVLSKRDVPQCQSSSCTPCDTICLPVY